MNRGAWHTDEGLVADVTQVLRRAETPPDLVMTQARAAFAWRDIAVQLAAIEYDSVIDDDEPFARVRGGPAERVLRFKAGETVASVVIDSTRRLVGRLEPAAYRAVEVRQPSGSWLVEVDLAGKFLVDGVKRGALSLRCLPADARRDPFETEWVTV